MNSICHFIRRPCICLWVYCVWIDSLCTRHYNLYISENNKIHLNLINLFVKMFNSSCAVGEIDAMNFSFIAMHIVNLNILVVWIFHNVDAIQYESAFFRNRTCITARWNWFHVCQEQINFNSISTTPVQSDNINKRNNYKNSIIFIKDVEKKWN